MRKAGVLLFSGGLDSILAAKLLLEQKVKLHLLTVVNPFIGTLDKFRNEVARWGRQLGCSHTMHETGNDFLRMIAFPTHGYGKYANPCIDCRIHQIRLAKKLMKDLDASFVATGEVVGQRPMSQHRHMLQRMERVTDMEGFLLRPLSAQVLEPTLAEREGIIDRTKMCEMTGRSRKPQGELAHRFGIESYPHD